MQIRHVPMHHLLIKLELHMFKSLGLIVRPEFKFCWKLEKFKIQYILCSSPSYPHISQQLSESSHVRRSVTYIHSDKHKARHNNEDTPQNTERRSELEDSC